MTGRFFPDWAILAVSLFNTILLLWLGLTVFLNAEKRGPGIWFATGGLLLGAIFFISHSAILGYGINPVAPGLNFWWQLGWLPVAALPLIWYVVMLWYCGFWEHRKGTEPAASRLYQRHRPWLYLATLASLLLIGFLVFAHPLPSFSQLALYDQVTGLTIGGYPLLVVAYPGYILLCTGLSLDVLRRPEPSGRLTGDLARARARRWLMAASLILLAVGLLVGWVLAWMVRNVRQGILSPEIVEIVSRFDFAIGTLIAVAVLMIGQAVVTYEVFTGKSLPRRGLSQFWRRAVILAAGYSFVLAICLTLQLRPIYSVLISMALMVVFYALLAWRAYAERERFIQNLRPFVANQGLFEGILQGKGSDSDAGVEGIYEPFQALCADLLEVRQACLVPLGELAPFSGAPLNYPRGSSTSLVNLRQVISRLASPAEIGYPLAPEQDGGMVFAVSLWSARGLSGVLLLGEKSSRTPFSQEEIEIARAVGEHLMDTKASLEMARRLIGLQRQRLVQSQVLDQRTRRVLHDEILPQVHTALLRLSGRQSEQGQQDDEVILQLEEIHRQLASLLHIAPGTTIQDLSRSGFIGALGRTIEAELQGSFNEVAWNIQPQAERALAEIPVLVIEVIFFAAREAVRNAAHHARWKGDRRRLCLSVGLKYRDGLVVTIEDNGVGIPGGDQDVAPEGKLDRLGDGEIANPGPELLPGRMRRAGSGEGLALHSTMMAVIGGHLRIESMPGQFTRVTLEVPETAWKSWE